MPRLIGDSLVIAHWMDWPVLPGPQYDHQARCLAGGGMVLASLLPARKKSTVC